MADEDCTSPPARDKLIQSHEEQQTQDSGCPPISLKTTNFEKLSDVVTCSVLATWALIGAITAFYTTSFNVKAFVSQVQFISPCVADFSQQCCAVFSEGPGADGFYSCPYNGTELSYNSQYNISLCPLSWGTTSTISGDFSFFHYATSQHLIAGGDYPDSMSNFGCTEYPTNQRIYSNQYPQTSCSLTFGDIDSLFYQQSVAGGALWRLYILHITLFVIYLLAGGLSFSNLWRSMLRECWLKIRKKEDNHHYLFFIWPKFMLFSHLSIAIINIGFSSKIIDIFNHTKFGNGISDFSNCPPDAQNIAAQVIAAKSNVVGILVVGGLAATIKLFKAQILYIVKRSCGARCSKVVDKSIDASSVLPL